MTNDTRTDVAPAEMMAIALSREVVDGEFGGIGAASQIPAAALRLAQLIRTPNLSWFSGGSGGVNPRFDSLYDSSADYRVTKRSEVVLTMEDVVDFEVSARFDFAFLGGMQIDKYGNVNMAMIGDWHRPKVRGPGTVGLIFMGGFKKIYLYVHHHDPRIFVEKVDFISGPGFLGGKGEREKLLRPECQGPVLIMTPLAHLDFDEETKRVRLKSYHPGRSVEEVQANTGFELIIPPDVHETPPPTPMELELLRKVVDRDGVLKRLI